MRPTRPDWRIAAVLFLVSFFLLIWQNGNRFPFSLDEGIYLDGASRVARGGPLPGLLYVYRSGHLLVVRCRLQPVRHNAVERTPHSFRGDRPDGQRDLLAGRPSD